LIRRSYASAQAACGSLGLHLPDLDATALGHFERYLRAKTPPTKAPNVAENIETLRRTAIEASYEAEPQNVKGLDAQIGEPESYTYKMLAELLSGEPRRGR
jgi:hypothetical protein